MRVRVGVGSCLRGGGVCVLVCTGSISVFQFCIRFHVCCQTFSSEPVLWSALHSSFFCVFENGYTNIHIFSNFYGENVIVILAS